jgi:hypothetical protein
MPRKALWILVGLAGTGIRSYCGDCRGTLCSRADGRAPVVKDGQCTECDLLR